MRGQRIARLAIVGVVLGAIVEACTTGASFECSEDDQCGTMGTCQVDVGFCSFPDSVCDSGQRFGEHAGAGLADTCVELGPDTDTDPPSGSSGPTLEPDTTSLGDGDPSDTSDDDATTTGGPAGCPADWWDCDFSWRLPLDVGWSESSQVDFVVRVSLDPSRLDPDLLAPGGADLRVVTTDGTVLPHELEWIEPARGRAEVWTRLPELSEGVRVWLYGGNPAAADVQDPPAVWAAGYAAVWHLGPALADGTGVHPLLDAGTMDAEGVIGRARQFDGVTSLLQPASGATFLELFDGGATVSAWINPDAWGQGGFGRIMDNSSTNTSIDGWSMSVTNTGRSNGEALRFAMGFLGNRGAWESVPNSLELGVWQHVAVTFDTTDPALVPALYRDGVSLRFTEVLTPMGDPSLGSGLTATIGAMATGDLRFFAGRIDELRVSSVPRSAQWLAAEAAAGRDQVLSYGAVQLQPPP